MPGIFFFIWLFLFQSQIGFCKDSDKQTSKVVVSQGNNRQPVFVTNTSFIFISKDRKYHKDPQIYFKDLKTGKEKRITFQRGQVASGVMLDKQGKIIYSSSTDEEKETPYILKPFLDRFPSSVLNDSFFHIDFTPQEIYTSKVDGSDIQRLTNYVGYDGFPSYLEKSDRLYFSRWVNGKLSFYAKPFSKDLEPWKVLSTAGHDLGLQLSPSQEQFVWFRFSPDFKSSQLLLSETSFKNQQFLTLETGFNWSPTWHPNGQSILFSSRTITMKDFDLFEVSVDGSCQRQLTSYEGDEFFPSISPDGKTILFTATQSGNEQIHQMDYPGPLLCKKN